MSCKYRRAMAVICILAMFMLTVTGCAGGTDNNQGGNGQQTADKQTVRLLYVQWACAAASTHIMADILKNKMGYDVELLDVTAAAMYEGLSNGEGDAIFCAWLPTTHGEYLKKVQNQVEDLGPNMEGARIGLVVPTYVDINSIEEMNNVKDKFNRQIIGIDPGAGIMRATSNAIDTYNLDYDLLEGSDATMTAALKQAIDNNDWIVVTGWTPHWKFARWDLKFLEDPKNVYGEAEKINTVVRNGLKSDMPEVYELFDKFSWTPEDLAQAMIYAKEEGGDNVKAARRWVEENPELVNSWLPEQYQQ